MPRRSLSELKPALDHLYATFHAQPGADPVFFVHRYTRDDDREVVGFCAAALAFGRVASVMQSIEALLAAMGASPAAFVRGFDARRDAAALAPLIHRWTRGSDLAALMLVMKSMLDRHGSLERSFAAGLEPDAGDVGDAIESFSRRALDVDVTSVYGAARPRPGVAYFFPCPSGGSACKRLNLYLRWMVRRDAIDPGGWTRVRPSQLIVPLDTHIVRLGKCLRLTAHATPGWRMAQQITSSLRAIDPGDPVKYDFALCHLGMMGACGFSRAQADQQCPLRGACRPSARRRRGSGRPSARP